jgi:hypothetical protein
LVDVIETLLVSVGSASMRLHRLTPNGQPPKTCWHQSAPRLRRLGNALSDDRHRRDVHLIRETGFNFLRLAHYPQDLAVLDEAGRTGLVIWEEIPIVNLISTSAAFAENGERMLFPHDAALQRFLALIVHGADFPKEIDITPESAGLWASARASATRWAKTMLRSSSVHSLYRTPCSCI